MFYWYVQKLLMNIKKFWANWECVTLLIAFPFRFYFWGSDIPLNYLSALDFFKSLFHDIDFWTWSLSISNLIFAGYTGITNQVWNRERSLMTSHLFWLFLTYLPTLSYSITSHFRGYLRFTLIWDVINERSHKQKNQVKNKFHEIEI